MAGKKYDQAELDTALEKIDAHLTKSTEAPDEGMEIAKALTEVAAGAIDLAKSQTKRGKKKAKAQVLEAEDELAKASKDEEDEEDEDEEDDKDGKKKDMPGWLKNIVHDGKSEGEMILTPDRDSFGHKQGTNAGGESRSMSKSIWLDGTEVTDIEAYLQKQLHEQADMTKSLKSLTRLCKGLVQGLVACTEQLEELHKSVAYTQQISGTCAKGLGWLMERQQDAPAPVVGSKYATMEKSAAAAEQLVKSGGTTLPYTKEKGFKALQKGLLTETQHRLWKTTGTLPPGVDPVAVAS